MTHRDIKPANIILEVDTAELDRWTAAAAQDGAADLEQWIKVLVMARVRALATAS